MVKYICEGKIDLSLIIWLSVSLTCDVSTNVWVETYSADVWLLVRVWNMPPFTYAGLFLWSFFRHKFWLNLNNLTKGIMYS